MGECMVVSWLNAHRGQMPDRLWEARSREWTAEVSAAGWRRTLDEIELGERPAGTLLVAEEDGAIVGVGMVSIRGVIADVDALYVVPDRQRAGIGARLLTRLADAVTGVCTTIELGVLEANAPARRFYERLGGAIAGRSTTPEGDTELPTVVYRWERERLAGLRDR